MTTPSYPYVDESLSRLVMPDRQIALGDDERRLLQAALRPSLPFPMWIERDANRDASYPDRLMVDLSAIGCSANWFATFLTREQTEQAEALGVPTHPGIHRAPDGTWLIAPGATLPEGWEMRAGNLGPWRSEDQPRITWWECRPIPKPATERVPWHEAAGRKRPSGFTIDGVERNARGDVWLIIGGNHFAPDAFGTVEVLTEGGES